MDINTEKIVSISDANQNFSKTARLADKLGEVFIFKNNKPRYRLTVIEDEQELAEQGAEQSEKKAAKLLGVMKKYRKAFEELLRISDK